MLLSPVSLSHETKGEHMFTVQGSWQVDIDNVPHTIKAELSVNNFLQVYFDNSLIHKSYIVLPQGEVYGFEKDGHKFALRSNGFFRPTMSFTLLLDDREIGQTSKQPMAQVTNSTRINVIREQNVEES